jgi:hypothetical protein
LEHLLFAATVLAAAAAFAAVEVQIEGESGWAGRLPTWRLDNGFTRAVMGGRPLTGYHLYCHLFVLVVAHLPMGMGYVPWTLQTEARALAFVALFWVAEDFLWFVINPRYGLGRFREEHIPWHSGAWWWIMPREYWIFLPAGLFLYWFSHS